MIEPISISLRSLSRSGRAALAVLLFVGLHMSVWSQPPTASQQLAADEIARQAADEFRADANTDHYQHVGVIARGGDMSGAVAEALASALRAVGRTAADAAQARAACAAAGVGWATAEPVGAREIAIMTGECEAQGVVLVRAETTATEADGTVTVLAQLVLADAAEIGYPWSLQIEQEARAAQRQSGWREHPRLIVTLIGALMLIWILSALRRRAKG